jgi:amino acid transporter
VTPHTDLPTPSRPTPGRPLPIFSAVNAVAVVVGVVVGIGIFRLPPVVAQHAGSGWMFLAFWLIGGAVSLLGALCYVELSAAHPDAGGEYHFLRRAYGAPLGFLFSWGRMTVIQTGSIALAAFILGDYATRLLDLGAYSSPIYASVTIVGVTILNLSGATFSKHTQNLLTSGVVGVLVLASIAAMLIGPDAAERSAQAAADSTGPSLSAAGSAMIFVLLTYGGWNEAAYLSGELHNVPRNMLRALVGGIVLVTVTYLLINFAYLHILGLEGLQASEAVGADLTEALFGPAGGQVMAGVVVVAALSTINATVITGARTNYALGRDFPFLGFLGRWSAQRHTPSGALLVQGVIALALIGLGTATRQHIETMVDYTAPVFWFFLMLTGVALFIFRWRDGMPAVRVPLYPVVPVLFVVTSAGMLYSAMSFTGIGALVGVIILLTGLPVLAIGGRWRRG